MRAVFNAIASLLILVTVGACAKPDQRPQGSSVTVTSGVDKIPWPDEELADPAIQEIIQRCESQGWPDCYTREIPKNDLRTFDRAIHREVRTLFQLVGIQTGRNYIVTMNLHNPNGDLFYKYTLSQSTLRNWHPSYSLDFWFLWQTTDQKNWQLGRWCMEIFVND